MLSNMTKLRKKVFTITLPKDKNGSYQLLKDEDLFISTILEIQGCLEVQGMQRAKLTGTYDIVFDVEKVGHNDSEVIALIDNIANYLGFQS